MRMGSSIKGNLEYDEGKLMDAMKKVAAKDGDMERAVKLSQVQASFQRNTDYRRKWAILQFLLRLSERVQMTSANLGGRSVFSIDRKSGERNTERTITPMDTTPVSSSLAPSTSVDAWAAFKRSKEGSQSREQALLKDLVGVLQGCDGHYIKFDDAQQAFCVTDPCFETPLRSLAEDLSTIGATFRTLKSDLQFIRPACGLVAQGFKSGLCKELDEFAKVVALFESMVAGDGQMSLRRAAVWLWTPRKQLELLAGLSSIAKECTGPVLLNRVAEYQSHGCKTVKATVDRLLDSMCRPYAASLSEWVYRGILTDPFNELFVVKKVVDSAQIPTIGQDCWANTYVLDATRIPLLLVSEELAERILVTGKTLNLLRLCDSLPNDSSDMMEDAEVEPALDSSLSQINSDLDGLYKGACKRLGSLLFHRHGLLKHLQNLQSFLLLSRSDFADTLLDSLHDSLNRPASSIFRHNLVGALDSSVRTCAPEDCDSIILHLDVRLHEPSPNGRQLGWDIFSLDYRIPSPLDALLTPETMREYTKLSQYLWLEKRILHTIRGSCGRLRAVHRMARQVPDLFPDFKRLQLLHHEALSLVSQIVQFSSSCLAKSWSVFMAVLAEHTEADLDTYARLHGQYITSLKSTLLTCYNAPIRSKLMSAFSAVLKTEKACSMFEAYLQTLAHSQGLMDANTLKMLTELRSQTHGAARQLQSDMDELMNCLQRESLSLNGPVGKGSASNLQLLLDFNGYHERRGGFDSSKYTVKQL